MSAQGDATHEPGQHLGRPDPERAYREAAGRDPRRFPLGYLASDPGTGAVGAFVWFATLGDLLGFLRTTEVDLLRLEPGEADAVVRWLDRTAGATRDVTRIDRDALSAAFAGWVEIAWLGTFGDLCERGGEF
jgi:hypothetical protein